MKLKDIINIVEKRCPPSLAYEWDNVGLLVGNAENEIHKIITALDVTPETAAQAARVGAELIISHHPILLSGTKKITCDTPEGRLLHELISGNVSLYAAHTSMDVCAGGINDRLAELIGLADIEIIEKTSENAGLGRIGRLAAPMTLEELCQKTKDILHTPLRYVGNPEKRISSVAVCSGSCSDLIPLARSMGADVLITADIKYHTALDCRFSDFALIDAGHFPTEIIVTDIFAEILKDTGLEIITAEQTDSFRFCV